MADTTTTPNMNLPVPTASEAPGPTWASSLVTDMYAIDSHNHSSGQGVQITPDGMSINADLPFGSNNATGLRSVRFVAQAAPLSTGADLGCVYVSGKDLYYNDEDGNQVRITTGGNVNAGAGSISGLPSGTASASFAAGTFTWRSATNTPAAMSQGPTKIARSVASSFGVTINANASQAADYSLTLPAALPAASNYMTLDNSGNVSYDSSGATGTGPVVRAVSPALTTPGFTGVPTGTVTGGAYAVTIVDLAGTTTAAGVWIYQRVGNIVSVYGAFNATPTGGTTAFTATVPLLPTSNFAAVSDAPGTLSVYDGTLTTATRESEKVEASVGAKTIAVTLKTANSNARYCGITFAYSAV